MKQFFRSLVIALALLMGGMYISAQEVNTLYFLENAPQRSMFNPALMPVSTGYLYFTPLGYTSMSLGNQGSGFAPGLTMSDLFYTKNGKTITAFNQGETDKFLKKLGNYDRFGLDMTTTLLAFGAATKKGGYFHAGIFLHGEASLGLSKRMATSLITPEGLTIDMTKGFDMGGLALNAEFYTEIMGGYTRPINDKWTVGGKLKLLLGIANIRAQISQLSIAPTKEGDASQPLKVDAAGDITASVPPVLDTKLLLPGPNEGLLDNFDKRLNNMMGALKQPSDYVKMLVPAGYGAAIDLGFTYKPIKYVQIAAAINDLGFMYWTNGLTTGVEGHTQFEGFGQFELKAENGKLNTDELGQKFNDNMQQLVNSLTPTNPQTKNFVRLSPRTRLNISVDGLFWENRVGLGLLSQTKFINDRVYEELTIGGFFRPVNWFNLAASYSILNGHGGNIGAALGFAPYDGIMLTLATDYVPLYYADASPITKSGKPQYYLPYKTPGLNVAFGFSIVWGTNKKRDADKDGVLDKFDLCPNTPRNVRVDAFGCPADTDGDGVPDYMDECLDTPQEAYGMTDSVGCSKDSDLDGVPDYKDLCPNTPEEARSSVDENGCTRDSDHDGVPDYRDDCPNTLPEAIRFVDEHGCDKDSDGDGVPDYIDRCPNTPEEAYNYIDEYGCPLDTDGDEVPDYKDKCPRTVYAARHYVDSCGCDKDTDLDGVPDYMDECPYVPGVKENKGCPQIKRAVTTLLKKAMSGIQFETGKAVILKKSYPILDEVAKVFKENPSYIIEVQGHTDNVGNAEVNKNLSQKRAQAVRDYLIKAGVDSSRMTANGYGSDMPIDDNSTKAGRAKNRRVEFKITFEEVHYEVINDHIPAVADSTAAAPAEPVQQ